MSEKQRSVNELIALGAAFAPWGDSDGLSADTPTVVCLHELKIRLERNGQVAGLMTVRGDKIRPFLEQFEKG